MRAPEFYGQVINKEIGGELPEIPATRQSAAPAGHAEGES